MSRIKRQAFIENVIKKKEISTQEQIVTELLNAGYTVTQATVSRDIKEMGLIKIARSDKGYKYCMPRHTDAVEEKYSNIFKEAVLSIKKAGNIIVVLTVAGSANSACAFIDKLSYEDILGSIAGDDTVIMIISSEEKAEAIVAKLQKYL